MTRDKKSIIEDLINQIVDDEKIKPATLKIKDLEPIAKRMQEQIKHIIEQNEKRGDHHGNR